MGNGRLTPRAAYILDYAALILGCLGFFLSFSPLLQPPLIGVLMMGAASAAFTITTAHRKAWFEMGVAIFCMSVAAKLASDMV